MMARASIFLLFGTLVLPVYGNGGGYILGGVDRTGNLAGFVPEETDKIRIVDEVLTVTFGPREAEVDVRYLMRNESSKRTTVRFGFPVEETFDQNLVSIEGAAQFPASDQPAYCRDYTISAAGSPLEAVWEAEHRQAGDGRFAGLDGWLVSRMKFSPGEEKPVAIRFKSRYSREEWFVSENTSLSPAIFRYRLSTAACWAETIGKGRIVLEAAGIPAHQIKVLKPVNRFKREGDRWVWEFEDLEPTLADDLEIEVRPARRGFREVSRPESGESVAEVIEEDGKWSMVHSNYKVSASSTLPPEPGHSYEADQVKSLFDGVWAEGAPGPGAGEWLELEPLVAKPLQAISLLPGYASGKDLFLANARPKRVLVELNREHRFHADVEDRPDEVEIHVIGYNKPVEVVRLTFEEVWPGQRHEDLCISSIQLHVALDKKPEIQPSR